MRWQLSDDNMVVPRKGNVMRQTRYIGDKVMANLIHQQMAVGAKE
jgi:hypothetical protein